MLLIKCGWWHLRLVCITVRSLESGDATYSDGAWGASASLPEAATMLAELKQTNFGTLQSGASSCRETIVVCDVSTRDGGGKTLFPCWMDANGCTIADSVSCI
uniref:Putative secreted protein n=1 Tax=Ixodes ricinus TaxID=34613 RepID=A0A6B0UA85_IXORI